MEQVTPKTWKPTAAGILNIITGALSAGAIIVFCIAIAAVESINIMHFLPPADAPFIAPLVNNILVLLLVLSVIHTIFPLIGGVFALQRKKWGWAFAGSLIAIFAVLPLGILSTIFVAMAKEEFE